MTSFQKNLRIEVKKPVFSASYGTSGTLVRVAPVNAACLLTIFARISSGCLL